MAAVEPSESDRVNQVLGPVNPFDSLDETVKRSNKGRKRKANPEQAKREVAKRNRHSGTDRAPVVGCTHGREDNRNVNPFCKANALSEESLREGWRQFYASCSKEDQDVIISNLIDTGKASRSRVSAGERQKTRQVTVKYHLRNYDEDGAPLVPVCKATFLSALGVKKDRVSGVSQAVFDQGKPKKEMRGGARDTPAMKERKERIRQHIETFSCRASHYSVKDNPGRKYLPSDFNVARMHKLFVGQNHNQVSYSLYYTVFRSDFNLGFGHPSTDKCATCEKYLQRVRDPELMDDESRWSSQRTASFIVGRPGSSTMN